MKHAWPFPNGGRRGNGRFIVRCAAAARIAAACRRMPTRRVGADVVVELNSLQPFVLSPSTSSGQAALAGKRSRSTLRLVLGFGATRLHPGERISVSPPWPRSLVAQYQRSHGRLQADSYLLNDASAEAIRPDICRISASFCASAEAPAISLAAASRAALRCARPGASADDAIALT